MSCTHTSSSSSPNTLELAFGAVLVVIGAVLTLDAFGFGEVTALFGLWPVALVVAGVTGLARTRDRGARLWAWAWIVVGAWLLLRNFGLTHVGFWDLFWPVVLIVVGLRLGMRAWNRPPQSERVGPGPGPHASHLAAIFGGTRRTVQEPFTGLSMTACFGGCDLDLRRATIPAGSEAVVDVFAAFGGHEIRVPDEWRVVFDVTNIAAGVDDRRGSIAYPETGVPPPTLRIRGTLIASGLTVR